MVANILNKGCKNTTPVDPKTTLELNLFAPEVKIYTLCADEGH
jgi:hypothetical protein